MNATANAWSDEAREAAAAARHGVGGGGGESGEPSSSNTAHEISGDALRASHGVATDSEHRGVIAQAGKMSQKASDAADRGKTDTAVKAHLAAADAHDRAASTHYAAGGDAHFAASKEHGYAATAHRAAAATLQKVATNTKTSNKEKGMTKNQRKQLKEMIDNCSCEATKNGLVALLNAKPDSSLADTTGKKGSVQGGGEEDSEDEDDSNYESKEAGAVDDDDEDYGSDGPNFHKVVGNRRVDPEVAIRNLSQQSPELAEVLNEGLRQREREKRRVVQHLVSNIADPKRAQARAKQLWKLPLDGPNGLRAMAELVPMTNRSYGGSGGATEEVYAPLFQGAAGGPDYVGNVTTARKEDEDLLVSPTTNWSQVADENHQRATGRKVPIS